MDKVMPPGSNLDLDISAISGISGAISIACWVVVFSPQIIENFRRSSAEGLSIEFIIIWLAGDIANIIGAILQGVLPTMIILAIYYTLADIVLLIQCFYYRGFTFRDPKPSPAIDEPTERSALLDPPSPGPLSPNSATSTTPRSNSIAAVTDRIANAGHHLSPATPLHDHDPPNKHFIPVPQHDNTSPQTAVWKTALFNATAIIVVIAAGVAGYILSPSWAGSNDANDDPMSRSRSRSPAARRAHEDATTLHFNTLGQVFGYACAVLYLCSRMPQLLLNYRRKSTEGLNALFFLFACLGNLTFVASILAFQAECVRFESQADFDDRLGEEWTCRPGEAKRVYARYVLVNLSWLIGSLGTLVLDMGVFAQFIMYSKRP